MGYRYCQRESQSFFIPASVVPALKDAFAKQAAQLRTERDASDSDADVLKFQTSWYVSYDEDGNVSSLNMDGEHKNYAFEVMWNIVSPFVCDGSFVEVEGEDEGDLFRVVWRDGQWQKKFVKQIVFED